MTIRETLKETIQMGTPEVIIESTSQIAINSLTRSFHTHRFIGNLVEDIKNLGKCMNSL